MIARLVVAVDDSPPGLAAGRLAVALAADWGAEVMAVFVREDGPISAGLISHVQAMATDAHVTLVPVEEAGQPFEVVLDQAWADQTGDVPAPRMWAPRPNRCSSSPIARCWSYRRTEPPTRSPDGST